MMKIYLSLSCVAAGLLFAVCGQTVDLPGVKTEAAGIEQLGSLRFERAVHSSTKLLDGRVLIAGGMRVNEEFHDTAEMFDPRTGKFEILASKMTKRRVSHTATLLKDGRVLIAGGWSNRNGPEKSTEIFDPGTGAFTAGPPMQEPRSGHTATLLDDGNVAIAGGHDGDSTHRSIEVFEPDTGRIRSFANLNTPRRIHTATKLNDGSVLYAGGEVTDNEIVSSAEILDAETGKTYALKGMAEARYKHDAVLLSDGRVLIYGGSDARDTRGRLKSAELYDPVKQLFQMTGELSLPRFKVNGTAVLLKDGRVLIAGGAEQAEIYDPRKGEFGLVKGNYGHSFHFASATLLDDGRALVTGGYRFRVRESPLATNGAWVFKNS